MHHANRNSCHKWCFYLLPIVALALSPAFTCMSTCLPTLLSLNSWDYGRNWRHITFGQFLSPPKQHSHSMCCGRDYRWQPSYAAIKKEIYQRKGRSSHQPSVSSRLPVLNTKIACLKGKNQLHSDILKPSLPPIACISCRMFPNGCLPFRVVNIIKLLKHTSKCLPTNNKDTVLFC